MDEQKTPAQIADEEAKRKKQERMAAARAAKAAKLSKPPINPAPQSDREQVVAEVVSMDNEDHPDYPGLTRGEVAAALERARAKAEKARRQALMEKVEKEELQRLKVEEGISTEPMVEFILDMPTVAYGKLDHNAWIMINGRKYYAGQKIVTTLSLARDMMHIAYCMRKNESQRLGQDPRDFYLPRNVTTAELLKPKVA